ncbi:MAG TPA: phytanoyl-CoA dioxygenase family protein [Chitinophagales bacterium]|nr:phytanoyl-CoA dioxygenase family protein [Chitinophagales bacterium]
MSKRIFKDDAMQARFEKQGFLVVPFIDAEEIAYLDKLFDELHPTLPNQGFVSGSYSPDIDYKKRASNEIVNVFSKHYERLFVNYQPFGAAFLFKMPSQNSELAIHQDWTIVDEEQYVALNCWVPLTDVNEQNGALQIVPGSHYDALKTLRAPTLPFFFSGNDDLVVKESIPMCVRAGEAVILNQSVIHYSPPNLSGKIRKAITAGVKSKGAAMEFNYKVPDQTDTVEVFEMPEDFLISFKDFAGDIFKRPYMGNSKGYRAYKLPQFTREELQQTISRMKTNAGFGTAPAKKEQSFFSRLAGMFK